jgi:sugar/nucleoside kinase (ribokinase family)
MRGEIPRGSGHFAQRLVVRFAREFWERRLLPEILVLGDVNADLIARTDRWPRSGEECLADRVELHCGGVGANCALALRQWGITPTLIACVGNDPIGEFLLKILRNRKVDLRLIQRTSTAMTGLLYINVTPDGQRTFFGSRGANRLVRPQPKDSPALKTVKAASLMGYSLLDPGPEKAAKQLLRAVRANGGWVSLDVGMESSQRVPRKILRLLREVDVLLVSNEEATALTGRRDPRDAFRALQRAGAREIVMKLGRHGCLIAQGGEMLQVPAFAVRPVDSTGAGDAFDAAFLQARLRGWPKPQSALVANAAGAVAAGVVGAGDNAPSMDAISGVLQKQRCARKWEALRLDVIARLSTAITTVASNHKPSAGNVASR